MIKAQRKYKSLRHSFKPTGDNKIDDVKFKFIEFHNDNLHVFELFQKKTFELIDSGKRKVGSKMIIENIRYDLSIKTESKDCFKINNNYTAWYTRLFEMYHPDHKGVFEKRCLK